MASTSSLLSGIALLVATHSALAQTDVARATARDAANSGITAFQAGQFEQAIDFFSRAEQLVHSPTHLLFMARAQAKLGQLVAAHENYQKIMREPLPPAAPKAFVDARAAAEEERGPLDARLPSITITVQGSAPKDVSVQMDGTPLPSAMVGIPLPADPGPHVFKATSGTAESSAVTLTSSEGSKQTVLLTLRPRSDSGRTERKLDQATKTTEPLVDRARTSGHALRTAAYVSFGVGAVGLGLGTVFLLKSASTRSNVDKIYDGCSAVGAQGICANPEQGGAIMAQDKDADGQRNVGVGALLAGGVGAAAGVALLVLDGRPRPAAPGRALRVTPLLGFRSVAVLGSF